VRFVVDHLAKPPIASGRIEPWASRLRPLGGLANVWCKISGMVTEADPMRWQLADLRPFVDHVLGVFGPRRLMFGSDWPVCLLAGSYEVVFDAAVATLRGLSAGEREAVFGGTAGEAYLLGPVMADRP
jgi:L-fuconolactonase